MKKNSIMVKSVLMSMLTAGIFTFGFTSCSDDDPMSIDSAAASQEIISDGAGISKPIGLVYTDFITESDVQILNADTTEIAISKALADKKGITNFVNHPMGIWQGFDQRAYMRRATAQRLVGDKYILTVVRSGLGEVLANQDVELNTSIFVNPGANTRGAAGMADKYTDSQNRIHPAAVTINALAGADGTMTRGAGGAGFGTLSAEQIMNGENFGDANTRGFFSDAYNAIKRAITFINNVRKNGLNVKGEDHGKIMNLEGDITPPKIHIKLGDKEGDTLTINSKIPYELSLDYTLKLDSKVKIRSIWDMWEEETLNPINFTCNYFEGRLDGEFSVEPQMTMGFGAKLEIPEEKQNIKLCDLGEITFTFMAGVVPVAVTLQPHLNLHLEAGVEGKVTTGIKYEYASEFSAGVKYDKKNGGWSPIAKYETTKNEFSFIRPRGTFKAEAAAGVLLACDVLVDYVAGPTLSVGPLVKAGMEAKLGLYDEVPFTFKAGVKAGIYGRAGAKIKLWKIQLFEWQTELTFGPEWDIWSYEYDGKRENSKGGSDELAKQVKEMKKELEAESAAAKAKKTEEEAAKSRQAAENQQCWNAFVNEMKNDAEVQNLVKQLKPFKGYIGTVYVNYTAQDMYKQALENTYKEAIFDNKITPEEYPHLKSYLIKCLSFNPAKSIKSKLFGF
jgi:hypothetical protein